jgi:hypothetical protein
LIPLVHAKMAHSSRETWVLAYESERCARSVSTNTGAI